MLLDQFIHADCLDEMKDLPDEVVDLIVTSPPWDRLRIYGGGNLLEWEQFCSIAAKLRRILKDGGVICWHWQDQIRKGMMSGTGLKMTNHFLSIGFSLHTVITVPVRHFGSQTFYAPAQSVLVLSKGKPQPLNLIHDVLNKRPGCHAKITRRDINGRKHRRQSGMIRSHRLRTSVWDIPERYFITCDSIAQSHPCPMHERLAQDLIYSWSKEGDLVLDPFAGAATTLKVASLIGRHYLGFEIVEEYWKLGSERLKRHVGLAS